MKEELIKITHRIRELEFEAQKNGDKSTYLSLYKIYKELIQALEKLGVDYFNL